MDTQNVNHVAQASVWLGLTWIGDHIFQLVGTIGVIVTMYFGYRKHVRETKQARLLEKKMLLEIERLQGE